MLYFDGFNMKIPIISGDEASLKALEDKLKKEGNHKDSLVPVVWGQNLTDTGIADWKEKD